MRGLPIQLYNITPPPSYADLANSSYGFQYPKAIWYSQKSGNWNDPTTWLTLNEIESGYPGQSTTVRHDVYIRHTVTWNLGNDITITLNNLFVSGEFFAGNQRGVMILTGNVQASGLINFTSGTPFTFIVNGSNNSIANFLAGASTVAWNCQADMYIPNLTYFNLHLGGKGVKRLINNLTIPGTLEVSRGNTALIVAGATQIDPSIFSLVVIGTTQIFNTASYFICSGSGSLLFTGLFSFANTAPLQFDFSSGNPTVEFKNGIQTTNPTQTTIVAGSGLWSFSTNSQSIITGTSRVYEITAPVLIKGAITLTLTQTAASTAIFANSINGDNVASTFTPQLLVQYKSPTAPMVTGVLNCNSAANNFKYIGLTNQDVTAGTYRTLEFGGSGAKKLLGNILVNVTAGGGWSITGTATINYNGFTITNI